MIIKNLSEVKKEKILITGGAGFIGLNLVHSLMKNNEIVVIDDLSFGYKQNIPEKVMFIEKDILEITPADITNYNPTIIIHCAASLGVENVSLNPASVIDINYHGTRKLLESIENYSLKFFIYASTSEIYGESPKIGSKEDGIVSPQTPYSSSKLLAEWDVKLSCERRNLDFVIVRFFNVFGQFQDNRFVIPKFFENAKRNLDIEVVDDGTQIRTFVHVNDVVKIIFTLINKPSNYGILNIGSPYLISILDLAKLIKNISNSESNIIFKPGQMMNRDKNYETRYRKPNLTKLLKIVGPMDFINIAEGLENLFHNHAIEDN
ncbi:MAG: dTDP-glucose 4,6-dehydratase [Candidatus Heimdallarchaeota archaeon LC_2]|nr:MAG: dTDP-glucose 4,6-dehydratase [Candidatus Heimdallarchaeota archaeon LC_2]